MKTFAPLLLLALAFTGCGVGVVTEMCGPGTCSDGCCDSSGVCRRGITIDFCGAAGSMCSTCNSTQECSTEGHCVAPGSTGGGTGATGGGTSNTGGGSTNTGGGTTNTGGGTTNTGGGTTNTGGGTGNTGGGTGNTGGGTTNTGGGTGNTGGGAGNTGGGGIVGGGGGSTSSQPALSDPVTTALTAPSGSKTYEVGPGKTWTPDTMPWTSLVAGDVVNIYPNTNNADYLVKFCLSAQGTASKPVIINGVTDSTGRRPRFNFKNARTAADCSHFFTTGQWTLEGYGGLVIGNLQNAGGPTKASFITVKNLELTGAAEGNSYTTLAGGTGSYSDSASVWIQLAADVTLENDIVSDSGFGVFVMTKNSDPNYMCERITLRNNRIFGNGTVGSFLDHNVYMQSTNPIVEGNFIGQLRTGALGSSYKSRSSGEIFRYNYVVASARAIDWVHSEDSYPGVASQSDYGTDYAYGNVVIADPSLPYGPDLGDPIHYGGDNCGEQSRDISKTISSANIGATLSANCGGGTVLYRQHLYFYNNTVLLRGTDGLPMFEPSLVGTQVDAWNNVFAFTGSGAHALLDSVGQLALRGNNLVFGSNGAAFDDVHQAVSAASGTWWDVATFGTTLTSDPLFMNAATGDVRLGSSSPAVGQGGGAPSGASAATGTGDGSSSTIGGHQLPFAPVSRYLHLPVTMQPVVGPNGGANGMQARASANDLGALGQ